MAKKKPTKRPLPAANLGQRVRTLAWLLFDNNPRKMARRLGLKVPTCRRVLLEGGVPTKLLLQRLGTEWIVRQAWLLEASGRPLTAICSTVQDLEVVKLVVAKRAKLLPSTVDKVLGTLRELFEDYNYQQVNHVGVA